MDNKLCTPAVVFVVYMVIQIFIDIAYGYYNVSLIKFILMVGFAVFLNWLCSIDAVMTAWILVFLPFALLSLLVFILLYTLKMNQTTGRTSTETEIDNVTPVLILPNNQTIKPIKNCIVVTNVSTPKHGLRTKTEDKLFCM